MPNLHQGPGTLCTGAEARIRHRVGEVLTSKKSRFLRTIIPGYENPSGPFAVQHYGPIFTCHLAAALIDVDQLHELRVSLDHWLSFRTFQHVSSATAPNFWWN